VDLKHTPRHLTLLTQPSIALTLYYLIDDTELPSTYDYLDCSVNYNDGVPSLPQQQNMLK
jgi:hypothetical protein